MEFPLPLEITENNFLNYSYYVEGYNRIVKKLHSGTAFFYEFAYTDVVYLITNYHVLTGRDPRNKKDDLEAIDICTDLRIYFRSVDNPKIHKVLQVSLYDEDEKKLFSVFHENDDSFLDVAVICISKSDIPPNVETHFIGHLDIYPFSYGVPDKKQVYVVGFANGLAIDGWAPTVISARSVRPPKDVAPIRPEFQYDEPVREGMSGSPIYAGWNAESKRLTVMALHSYYLPNGKSGSVYIKYAWELIQEMYFTRNISVELKLNERES